ncbi:DUF2079 domain-containing protein [candidate division WWE3 bacterium]|nr:DUF2079 domain-containing protein [candidate division WWE3 bacterium]
MQKFINFIKKNFFLIALALYSLGFLAVNVKMNLFSYHNFDFGKFDLGNMTQMVWNTMHGRFLYLTDYFGTNMPRWGMSHVDPILVLFVPVFFFFQSPLTLVFSQLILVTATSFLIYKLAELKLKSSLTAFLLALSYLLYPAVGFLTARTGFHGVTSAIFFFTATFYVFELMYEKNNFSTKWLSLFWVLAAITMSGKEQIPLYTFFFGLFIWLYRGKKKLGLTLSGVSFAWFVAAFFIIIPAFADYRIEGYRDFATNLGLSGDSLTDVTSSNYFLSRYEEFGETYTEVMWGMVTHPGQVARVFFGGEKMKNFKETLLPVGYIPFVYPATFIMALPDFLINYLTTAGGIGTAEIYNHRVSMIVPVVFISVIFSIQFLAGVVSKWQPKLKYNYVLISLAGLILGLNIYTSFKFNNPVYLWIEQAVRKRVIHFVHAKTLDDEVDLNDLEIGDVERFSHLENKDRECASNIVQMIRQKEQDVEERFSISGPDYLGAHLSMRETYAIFPALYNEADYVIVDVFSKKIMRILDADVNLVRDVVEDIIRNPDYKLAAGCGNLFVFEKVGAHEKDSKLPLQERYAFEEKLDLEIFKTLTVVDYSLPTELTRGENSNLEIAYVKRGDDALDGYFLFLTFVNEETEEMYQVANLPSFSLYELPDWTEDRYYIENLELALPEFLDAGDYKVFVGMSNIIRTRSLYLGDVVVK